MKTPITHSELQSRPEQFSTKTGLSKINFARRRANRRLHTQRLVALLRREAPKFFAIAEVVGHWVWIQFTEKQPGEVTSRLAELGFHWNNRRQAWQHPCGTLSKASEFDPRDRYGSYFPALSRAA